MKLFYVWDSCYYDYNFWANYLSKILGEHKFLGVKNVAETDKCMGIFQFLWVHAWAPPKVYSYGKLRMSSYSVMGYSIA